jgi:hypothetical protein
MKKMLTLVMALGSIAFVACNNSSDTSASNNDSTNRDSLNNANATTGSTANTDTSTTSNAAYADEIEKNSTQGRYVNAKTGKPYKKLSVNRTTGQITDENNQPVWRYVDSQNWWVYGLDDSDWTWRKLGEAKMDKDQLSYKDESGNWVSYDKEWRIKDNNIDKSVKAKNGDIKIKFGADGDIKVKDESGKTKYNADKGTVKTDSSK